MSWRTHFERHVFNGLKTKVPRRKEKHDGDETCAPP